MTKLLTLKDLMKKAQKEDELSFAGYTSDYLKIEAIKEIKFLTKLSKKGCGYPEFVEKELPFEVSCASCTEGTSMCSMEVIINYIKWKFNITDEDLK